MDGGTKGCACEGPAISLRPGSRLGVAVAFLHSYVPAELRARFMGRLAWWPMAS